MKISQMFLFCTGLCFCKRSRFYARASIAVCDSVLPAVVFTFSGAAWLLWSQLK